MPTNRNFEDWLATFHAAINDYYTDFAKVHEKAARLKPEIYLLNSLVGSKDIERDFENLLAKEGWKSARKNLKETFLILNTLYNIADLEDGILQELFNE